MVKTISILGAGKVGITLAQLTLKAGYEVYIAGSKAPDAIKLTVSVLTPGAHAVTKEEAARAGDIVILALPLSKYASIPKHELEGKLVIDSMNHWHEVDGPREATIANPDTSSSEFIQSFLSNATVVKALSHMGYHELHDFSAVNGSQHRKAIAIAGNSPEDVHTVSTVVDSLGFDPVPIGSLAQGVLLEPGHPGFGRTESAKQLKTLLLER